MVLIFGGKYQGMMEYALENFGPIGQDEIFHCIEEIDYSKKIIADLQEYVWQCTLKGIEAKEAIDWEKLKDKIIICDDVSGGLVPMDKDEREFREMIGRTLLEAGKRAEQVIRVFCGLGHRLK